MDNMKFVDFLQYCGKCKYNKVEEFKDPCNECLDCGAREGTEQPLYFEEGKGSGRAYGRNQ